MLKTFTETYCALYTMLQIVLQGKEACTDCFRRTEGQGVGSHNYKCLTKQIDNWLKNLRPFGVMRKLVFTADLLRKKKKKRSLLKCNSKLSKDMIKEASCGLWIKRLVSTICLSCCVSQMLSLGHNARQAYMNVCSLHLDT